MDALLIRVNTGSLRKKIVKAGYYNIAGDKYSCLLCMQLESGLKVVLDFDKAEIENIKIKYVDYGINIKSFIEKAKEAIE